ncbi:DUF92 domain-containing protein [Paenibacillus sp. Marseille-Q4541]|uniref:DUF92 domain-containing protein n=1 Tax=Paenibacillus sp. Marseille-Q4541 TaxID=2831522 RepID=UPI001BAC7BC7|nr:DUF92 domain-containing protein [Paenibacillus sp. Marseille-Q4541]
MDWIWGTLFALLVAGAAYRKKSLTVSGSAAAVVMGAVYYGAGNLFWFGTLLLFFITSTLLSRYKKREKHELEKSYAKTGNRDAAQVFANGGLGMILVILYTLFPHPVWMYVFVGIMATVTADTWATEIGSLSRRQPRSVITLKPVAPGTSGGVTFTGNVASMLGALVIGVGASLFLQVIGEETLSSIAPYALIGLVSGFAGAYLDSLFGATVQRMYRCPVCGKEVEVKEHCGVRTTQSRGLSWMSNDLVNLLSSLFGGALAGILGFLLF